MDISVSDPMGWAMTRTTQMLFKPFSIGKWFTIGFAAFLSMLAEGGGGNFPTGSGGGGGGGPGGAATGGGTGNAPPDVVAEAWQFFLRYAHVIIPVVTAAIVLWVVIVWVRARGKFIFLECVARNQAAIVEPWKRLSAAANSYFRFDLLLSVLMTLGLMGVALVAYAIALPDIRARTMGGAGVTAIVVGLVLFLMLVVVYLLVGAVAENFLIPLMYLREQRIGSAWTEFRTRILPGHLGIITAYFLLRGVLNVAVGTVLVIGTCLTCLIAAIPYLGTVLFLPLFVFMRAYSLHFLAQFGGEYNLVTEIEPPPISAFPVVFNQPLPPPPLDMPPPLPPREEP